MNRINENSANSSIFEDVDNNCEKKMEYNVRN